MYDGLRAQSTKNFQPSTHSTVPAPWYARKGGKFFGIHQGDFLGLFRVANERIIIIFILFDDRTFVAM